MSADPFHPLASSDTALFYRAAIGVRGQDYHLPRFLRFDEAGQTSLSWNWAASLFTFNWLIYRKMWGWALAYVGALAAAGLLVFGVGKLVFDYSGVLTWMLGLWLVSAAYIVPGLYANVWLYGHYNDRISEVLRKSSGVVDTIARLTAVAPGPGRLGRQLLANLLALVVLLGPVLALQDWQGLGGRAWSQLASLLNRDAPRQEAAAPSSVSPPLPTASGRVEGLGAPAPAATASGTAAGGVLTQAVAATLPAPAAPAASSARPVDDAAGRPVVAFEPAFDATTRSGRAGADVVPVTSFAANPVAPTPLNAPLPAPLSTSGSASASAPPPADLVPLQSVTLPTSRPQAPQSASAPRARQLAQADSTTPPTGSRGNMASGVVTRAPVAPTTSAAPPPPVQPTPPRAAAPAASGEGEKPQASARLRAASQAAQAKRAAQSQPGAMTASAAPLAGAGAQPLAASSPATLAAPPKSSGAAGWVVQAGVFRQADNAHRMVAQLQGMGIEAALENFPNSRGEPMLRVVAGPYAQQAQAQQTAQRIQARSLPAMVMREAR
ncbi:hypothetical protein AZ34_17415 [Hylemonella gracilis str. Niagara R]|uniref:SPOR domain-containing protein n=1 Tax=Hylemonella gracilis str. Niagara R TaxID=1458275 RepID=A0A016XM70_9BURK|nr:SPOR domain-containing protein [Hylemonella gracilis]EYC52980.1 hypothetical protein AZ34_17415 [Hylemonella gracilis str. Niagara R]